MRAGQKSRRSFSCESSQQGRSSNDFTKWEHCICTALAVLGKALAGGLFQCGEECGLIHGRPQMSRMQIPGHLCWQRLSRRTPTRKAVSLRSMGQWHLQVYCRSNQRRGGVQYTFCRACGVGGALSATSPTQSLSPPLLSTCLPACFLPPCLCLFIHAFAGGAIQQN